MKKTLILVRHATAEEGTRMVRDFDRELIGKGRTDALMMGNWLSDKQILPDRFLSSSAPRAKQTAVLMAGQIKYEPSSIISEGALYDGGPRAYLKALNATPEDCDILILFGHNPDITFFAEYLSVANIGSMSKCSIVITEFEDQDWAEISAKTGKFVTYITPRELRELH